MQRSFLLIILTIFLTSCVETALTGLAVGTYFIVRDKSIKDSVSDTKIVAQIEGQYHNKENRDKFGQISISSEEGRVLLSGAVKNQEDRVNAIKTAWKVKGVQEVINEIKITSQKASLVKDMAIATQIKTKWVIDRNVQAINYNVEVSNGIVYIMGNARSTSELRRAANIASQVKGVEKVISYARVR